MLPEMDSGAVAYLSALAERLPSASALPSLQERRARLEAVAKAFPPAETRTLEVRNWYVTAPGREIPIRIYRANGGVGAQPLIVFFHGGGWVTGSLDTHDYLAAALAEETACVVVSVHYRRPPENPHPAPVEDCYEALRWAAKNGAFLSADPERIAVVGDSAGAHLAACCSILARDRTGPKLAMQVLICPMIEPAYHFSSYSEFAHGPGLTREDVEFFWGALLAGSSVSSNSYAVPIVDDMTGLPPTLIVTAEIDPVRDEGEQYARRLEMAGVPVKFWRAARLPHGFPRARAFSEAATRELARLCASIRQALRGAPHGPEQLSTATMPNNVADT